MKLNDAGLVGENKVEAPTGHIYATQQVILTQTPH
jgi:hypothetical protein